jgi:hypothetical protein
MSPLSSRLAHPLNEPRPSAIDRPVTSSSTVTLESKSQSPRQLRARTGGIAIRVADSATGDAIPNINRSVDDERQNPFM